MSRLKDKWFTCLVGVLICVAPRAQGQGAYSPVVSFWTLPALQPATPKPHSVYVPGDFNGDGVSDLLWFNPETSQVGYWHMSLIPAPSNVTVSDIRTFNVTPGYYVGAVGDFNNDGYADLVLTSESRDLWLWTNNKSDGFTSEYMGAYPSEWQLLGAGDIDGDGYDDLLWLNPSGCQFAYWTMHGTTRTEYKIIPVTCGYYPIGIGYYSPSNRISILWTNGAKDLYIWDSASTGFRSYDLGAIYNAQYAGATFDKVWAIGGGFMGRGIGINAVVKNASGNGLDFGGRTVYSRIFDVNGNQIAFVRDPNPNYDTSGAVSAGWQSSGGYLVAGNSTNGTGLYYMNKSKRILSVYGANGDYYYANIPLEGIGTRWTYPEGWWIVGAPGNGTAAPPWQ